MSYWSLQCPIGHYNVPYSITQLRIYTYARAIHSFVMNGEYCVKK